MNDIVNHEEQIVNTKEYPSLPVSLHRKTALAIYFAIETATDLMQKCQDDPKQDVIISTGILTELLQVVLMLSILCSKHNLIDMGAIESVWAENLHSTSLSKLSRVFDAVRSTIETELELPL